MTASAVTTRSVLSLLALANLAGCAHLVATVRTPTTYAAVSETAARMTLVAALALTVAGLIGWWSRPGVRSAPLAVAAGAVWTMPVWVGWEDGSPLVRSLAALALPLLPVLLLHVAVAHPWSRPADRGGRLVVAAAWTVAGLWTVTRALVRNPFRDLYAWSNLRENNLFLVADLPGLARGLDVAGQLASVALCGLTVAWAALRLVRTTPVGRRRLLPVLGATVVAGAAEASLPVLLLAQPLEDPDGTAYLSAYLLRAAAFAAMGGGFLWTAVRTRERGHELRSIQEDLDRPPGSRTLESRLATAVGDPSLRLVLALSDGRLVDCDGRATGKDPSRGWLPLVRGDEILGYVEHDPALDVGGLVDQIGPLARLAIDNERLGVEVLAQLVDLRASRTRIVAAADDARRRMERDLHDGAQQRLLAASYELRVAAGAARAAGDVDRENRLLVLIERASAAVEELRDLAHGIYPAALDHGRDAGLRDLAETAALPVEICCAVDGSRPGHADRAAYLIVSEAISRADEAGAAAVTVVVRRVEDLLVLEVAPFDDLPPLHLADRIGALGGRLRSESSILYAEVPCE